MKRTFPILCLIAIMAVLAVTPALAQQRAPDSSVFDIQSVVSGEQGNQGKGDDLEHPLGKQQRALREKALEAKLNGKAPDKVLEVAKGQYVELEREGEDSIWTIIAEFGNLDSPFAILQSGVPGPQHNQIPEPDRSVDNSTIWVPDFGRDYYLDILFSGAPGASSMRSFYIEQSSGRYAVNGDVTDWAQVPYNTAHYGRDWCGSIVCSTTWWFVQDAADAWYGAQIAAGMTAADIEAYLSQFDVWDRYDWDGDGNFDEPDGYIDHFQVVHSGEGQEAGGGAYGSDAIWSHRWYANYNLIGSAGPSPDYLLGGVRIGDSNYWIGDYTIEPENGGVGVFAHEFGHDLDLPDLYDTSGNTCGSACENSTGFWTLMSSGSWLSDGTQDIGSKPGHMGVWEKFQLGWLNYEVAFAGQLSEHKLGPAETNTKQAQGLFVVLPDKEVVSHIGDPYEGTYFYYSGAGNDLDNVMYRSFNLAPGSSLSAQVQYDIEVDWDYAYLVASTDGGTTWTSLETNLSTPSDPNGQNFGFGITGSSGGWTTLTADLSAYSGDVLLGFRYWTDAAVVEPGLMVDSIDVTGYPTDGAETDAGWTFDGFRVSSGTETSFHFNAYVAEFRQYRGYDQGLRVGPYNFGFLDNPALGNYVERFPYQDGLLISYWDSSQTNNSTSAHPGQGLILPIDAHPQAMIRSDGGVWRSRMQTYDSTFSLEPTEAITLHWLSQPSSHPSQPPVPVFDDNIQYYNPDMATAGVINPHTGTQIRIQSVSAQGSFMQVQVRPSK
jgi:immune inhibitor A